MNRAGTGTLPPSVLDRAGLRVQTGDDAVVADQVQVVAVEDVRDHVAGALGVFPGDALRRGDVARAQRDDLLLGIAGGHEHQAVPRERRVNGIALDAARAPQLLAAGRVVGDDELRRVRHQLDAPPGIDEDRRRPGDLHVALRPPGFLARALVVGDDRRTLAVVLVALNDHEVLVQNRRGARTHAKRRKVLHDLPRELAVHAVGVETLGTEVGEHHFPVGGRRRSGKAAGAVARVVDRPLVRGLLPDRLAVLRLDRQHLERVVPVCRHAVGMHPGLPFHRVLDGLPARQHFPFHGRGHEQAVAPHRRRGMPGGHRHLPAHVAVRLPLGWNPRLARNPLSARPAPLRPVLRGSDGGQEHGDDECGHGSADGHQRSLD